MRRAALPNECRGAKSQREKGRNFFPSSLLPSLPCRAAFANSACFTCDAENLAGEGERERRRMRTPIFFFALPPPSPFIRRPTARFFFH